MAIKIVYCAVIAILGYLIGSISMSIIITKYFYKDDVRDHGSGNAGATNVARVFGWGPGIITFLCDFLKCVLSVFIGYKLGQYWNIGGAVGYSIAGVTCLLGHCFPVYFKFRGGKAVSTGAGIALLIDWRLFLIAVVVFALAFVWKRIVSFSSICAAVAVIIATPFFVGFSKYLEDSLAGNFLGIFTGLLIIFMHRENIRRMLAGTEKQFKAAKRKDKQK